MDVTPESLAKFGTWLRENGRSDPTVSLYTSCIRRCGEAKGAFTSSLVDRDLAPKTRRAYKAGMRSWALFTEDSVLERRLQQIKLPPAIRVRPKVELSIDDWRALVGNLRTTRLRPAMRAVLLIIALRGLRGGDVLRLRRREVVEALRTGVLSYEAKGGRRLEYDAAPVREQLEVLVSFTDWDHVRELLGKGKAAGISNKVRRTLASVAASMDLFDVYPHRLRRTYATHFLRRLDRDPQGLIKLQKHMGWSSMATAAGYVDATSADELNAIGSKLTSDIFAR